MTSLEIRKSFLDFFNAKGHTIVQSASLMPTSPNLLFTNAGMNQFVPYFLGEEKNPFFRAADTQKCIRAGGKHNDLEDVGFDTYHHTFFEMLGNWSFGDYFKEEAIEWAWELLVSVWKFPKERLYATVYKPAESDPSEFDSQAYDVWEKIFLREGLDPNVHIISCGKKDNFWMMGETGPCGPCSELHIDLTPEGDTKGSLVNKDSPLCIEIWNLVFIQYNAEADGTFTLLKNKHVDTGMGFERVAGIMATTKNFTDFSALASNYNSDLFTDIFKHISMMSGKKYEASLPENSQDMSNQELVDCVFRILADHIRTLTFSIADGIMPGNEGRNYVLRRILRRAVMYGKRLNLKSGFFKDLALPVIEKMSPIFPELKEQTKVIIKVIENEERSFERTLDRGLQLLDTITLNEKNITGEQAFVLYDTYGFPLDLTQLIARERNIEVDVEGFEVEMQRQRQRARSAQKTEIISVSEASQVEHASQFIGYDKESLKNLQTNISAIIEYDDCDYIIMPQTSFYAEKGGQVGDRGYIELDDVAHEVFDTKVDKAGHILHKVRKGAFGKDSIGKEVYITVDTLRRQAIQRHHTATHILHWALRNVLGFHVKQAGSYVDELRLRFDFSHFESPTEQQLKEIETLANKKILENLEVNWKEIPQNEIPEDCLAFFGDKYGSVVRMVDVVGMGKELCGGTHVASTGEIGLIKIVSETAIAAGTRRLEAIAGISALNFVESMQDIISNTSKKLTCKAEEIEVRIDKLLESKVNLERELKGFKKENSKKIAGDIVEQAIDKGAIKFVVKVVELDEVSAMRDLGVSISKQLKQDSVVVLGASFGAKANVLALCTKGAVEAGYKAGAIVSELTSKLSGKGGGKPDFAMGGGSSENIDAVFAEYIQALS